MARASEDIRFNQMLSEACLTDREVHCNSTQQVMHSYKAFTVDTGKYCLPDSLFTRFVYLSLSNQLASGDNFLVQLHTCVIHITLYMGQ